MSSESNKGTVILTGAGGFVGLNVSRYFIEQGYKVIGLEINEDSLDKIKECGAEGIKCDLLKDDLIPIFKNADYLIHIAGLFRFDAPVESLKLINAKLVDIIMNAASKVNFKHIIHFSTTATYGSPKTIPVSEDFPQVPNDMYGKTKLKGEQIAWKYYKEQELPITVIRPTLIYGPGNPYGIGLFIAIGSLVKDGLRLKRFINIKGGTHMHIVHVEDIARVCEFLLNQDKALGEAYNVVDDNPLPIGVLMEQMLSIFKDTTVRSIIPHSNFLIKRLIRIAETRAFDFINPLLERTWKIFGIKANFDHTKMHVHLSPDWIKYMSSDISYSNKKLHDLGFKFKYPHPKKGLLENIIWYKKNKWVP